MIIEKLNYTNVAENGVLAEGGSIETEPIVRMGETDNGNCYILIGMSRQSDGTVEYIRATMSYKEFAELMATGEIKG